MLYFLQLPLHFSRWFFSCGFSDVDRGRLLFLRGLMKELELNTSLTSMTFETSTEDTIKSRIKIKVQKNFLWHKLEMYRPSTKWTISQSLLRARALKPLIIVKESCYSWKEFSFDTKLSVSSFFTEWKKNSSVPMLSIFSTKFKPVSGTF